MDSVVGVLLFRKIVFDLWAIGALWRGVSPRIVGPYRRERSVNVGSHNGWGRSQAFDFAIFHGKAKQPGDVDVLYTVYVQVLAVHRVGQAFGVDY